PATCGVAIEVPDRISKLLPVPDAVDTVDTPGAVTPGLSTLSPIRGPSDEKLAIFSNPGFGMFGKFVATAFAAPVIAAVSLCRTPKNGKDCGTGSKVFPLAGSGAPPGIGPSYGG